MTGKAIFGPGLMELFIVHSQSLSMGLPNANAVWGKLLNAVYCSVCYLLFLSRPVAFTDKTWSMEQYKQCTLHYCNVYCPARPSASLQKGKDSLKVNPECHKRLTFLCEICQFYFRSKTTSTYNVKMYVKKSTLTGTAVPVEKVKEISFNKIFALSYTLSEIM